MNEQVTIPKWFYQEIGTAGVVTLSWCSSARQLATGKRKQRYASQEHWLLIIVDTGAVTIEWQGIPRSLTAGMATILPPGAPFYEQVTEASRTAYLPIVLNEVSRACSTIRCKPCHCQVDAFSRCPARVAV